MALQLIIDRNRDIPDRIAIRAVAGKNVSSVPVCFAVLRADSKLLLSISQYCRNPSPCVDQVQPKPSN